MLVSGVYFLGWFFPALRRLEVPDAYDAYDAYDAVAREAPKRRSALLERTFKKTTVIESDQKRRSLKDHLGYIKEIYGTYMERKLHIWEDLGNIWLSFSFVGHFWEDLGCTLP